MSDECIIGICLIIASLVLGIGVVVNIHHKDKLRADLLMCCHGNIECMAMINGSYKTDDGKVYNGY